jgi:hypothetical protein
MIKIYIGTLGSGKTLTMVKDMNDDFTRENKRVISNLVLEFASSQISKTFFQAFAEGKSEELFDVTLGLDEIHIFLDSRRSTSKRNTYLSYFILQTRKRGVNLYATTQFLSQIDIRLRNVCDYVVKCEAYIKLKKGFDKVTPIKASKGLTQEEGENLWILNTTITPAGEVVKKEMFRASKYFNLYDTKQIINFE